MLSGLIAMFIACTPTLVCAKIRMTFWSHELGGTSFPHAFITLKGTLDRNGESVDTNFGFTAKSVTPAILMGSVGGLVESVKSGYVNSSKRQFSIDLSDEQYTAVIRTIEQWESQKQPNYNLNKRNCVHFVGELGKSAGLSVVFERKLIKRPEGFLLHLIKLNPWVVNEKGAKGALP